MYTKRVEEHLRAVLPEQGYGLDSVTFTREMGINYLRAFIFRTDGADMTVNDCVRVIAEEYMLEVCSLGFKENPGNEDIGAAETEEGSGAEAESASE